MDLAPIRESGRGQIAGDELNAAAVKVHEKNEGRAPGKRLDADRSGAREKVQETGSRHQTPHDIEERLLDPA